MKITIVGAGRVGRYLAEYFVAEHQDVYLVDNDAEKLSSLENDFNLRTFVGAASDCDVLRAAGADVADVFVAVSAGVSDNLVSCALAKHMGAKRTIARVDRVSFTGAANREVIRRMGVDDLVFPDGVASMCIMSALEHPWARSVSRLCGDALELAVIRIDEEAPVCGLSLRAAFSADRMVHVAALRRDGVTVIPHGDDLLLSGDELFVTALPGSRQRIVEMMGKEVPRIDKVLVAGGSAVAELMATEGAGRFDMTLIENDVDRCRELTQTCPDCNVIYGDAGEADVLDEAGLTGCDAFVSLTDNTESNILACLAAKDAGITTTVAEVEKMRLVGKAEALGIDCVVNKPILTAHTIYSLAVGGDTTAAVSFAIPDAEVVGMEIHEGSRLCGRAVKDLDIPRGITFGGMVRNGCGELIKGNTILEAGDRIIVFGLQGMLDKVKRLFK